MTPSSMVFERHWLFWSHLRNLELLKKNETIRHSWCSNKSDTALNNINTNIQPPIYPQRHQLGTNISINIHIKIGIITIRITIGNHMKWSASILYVLTWPNNRTIIHSHAYYQIMLLHILYYSNNIFRCTLIIWILIVWLYQCMTVIKHTILVFVILMRITSCDCLLLCVL